jgi:hypothetical protein
VAELGPLALLTMPLLVMAWTLDSARWVRDLPPLVTQAPIAVLAAYLVVRLGRGVLATHLIGGAVALTAAFGVGLLSLAGPSLLGMGIFLLALTWGVAYASVWLAYRAGSPWRSVVPGLILVTIALAFLPTSFYPRLSLYLVASAPALGLFNYRIRHGFAPGSLNMDPAMAAIAVAAVFVGAAWLVPSPEEGLRPGFIGDLEEPWQEFWERPGTLFNNVPNRREFPRISLRGTLPFTGPVAQTANEMLLVQSDTPRKWRLTTFETYTSEGWTTPSRESFLAGTRIAPHEAAPVLQDREEVRISVRTRATMDQIATAGIPVGSTIASVIERSGRPAYSIDLAGEQASYLPADVEAVRAAILAGDGRADAIADAGLRQRGEAGDRLVLERDGVDVAPRLALLFEKRLVPPRRYESVGDVSTASAALLRTAAGGYPQGIVDRYLQLPPDFPQRVKDAAAELAAGRDNVYDIALAIQESLRTIPYSAAVEPPPEGVDAVEWFLFESQVGFCNYYASAMITMLRSLGVPARLAVGFAPGDFDADRGVWVVRASNYHAWPEVYFPGFGWVEFEPTNSAVQPSLALLDSPRTAGSGFAPIGDELDVECAPGVEGCEDDGSGIAGPGVPLDPEGASSPGGRGLPVSAAAVAAALALAAGAWRWRTHPRLGLADRAYALVRLTAWLSGASLKPYETPRELGERLAARLPGHAASLRQVVDAYAVSRYSRAKTLGDDEARRLRLASRRLARGVPRAIRRRFTVREILRFAQHDASHPA